MFIITNGEKFFYECLAAVSIGAAGYGGLWFGAAMGWW